MNSWISDQLNKIDLRSEKYCAEFIILKSFIQYVIIILKITIKIYNVVIIANVK